LTPATYLLFTNECVGLGHLRRALSVAVAITERNLEATALIVTGAPIELAHPLPPRVDTVKLPLIARDSSGEQRAGRLAIGLPDVRDLRSQLALAAARSFAPAVAIVDKAPLGLGDELAPALEWLHRAGTKLVLGLRDIEDAPARVRREWERPLVRATFEHLYDAVVVYGPEGTEEHALACLDWDTTLPVHHVGYVASPPTEPGPAHEDDYVLATAGGGADGAAMLATFLDAVRLEPLPVPALLVTGPLMPEHDVRELHARAEGLDVTVETFRPGLDAAIASARGVVSMAGYNTVSELLRTGRPALLVPRTRPSREQCVRAEHLRAAGRADVLHSDELDARRMRDALDRLLATAPHEPNEGHSGATRTAELLAELAREPEVLEAAS
jgi:predicted glycosyltransferase